MHESIYSKTHPSISAKCGAASNFMRFIHACMHVSMGTRTRGGVTHARTFINCKATWMNKHTPLRYIRQHHNVQSYKQNPSSLSPLHMEDGGGPTEVRSRITWNECAPVLCYDSDTAAVQAPAHTSALGNHSSSHDHESVRGQMPYAFQQAVHRDSLVPHEAASRRRSWQSHSCARVWQQHTRLDNDDEDFFGSSDTDDYESSTHARYASTRTGNGANYSRDNATMHNCAMRGSLQWANAHTPLRPCSVYEPHVVATIHSIPMCLATGPYGQADTLRPISAPSRSRSLSRHAAEASHGHVNGQTAGHREARQRTSQPKQEQFASSARGSARDIVFSARSPSRPPESVHMEDMRESSGAPRPSDRNTNGAMHMHTGRGERANSQRNSVARVPGSIFVEARSRSDGVENDAANRRDYLSSSVKRSAPLRDMVAKAQEDVRASKSRMGGTKSGMRPSDGAARDNATRREVDIMFREVFKRESEVSALTVCYRPESPCYTLHAHFEIHVAMCIQECVRACYKPVFAIYMQAVSRIMTRLIGVSRIMTRGESYNDSSYRSESYNDSR
jgi:hypothetical protein